MKTQFFGKVLVLCLLITSAKAGALFKDDGPEYDPEKHRANTELMASQLRHFLQRNVSRAAIVSRVGSDLSEETFRHPSKQKFTHAGIVWKSLEDGTWRFKHMINRGDADPTSKILVHELREFFDDTPYMYDVYASVPPEELQDKIAAILESKLSLSLHNPRYSKISNPYSTDYQNSNEWVLSVIISAQTGFRSLEKIQTHYLETKRPSSQVKISSLKAAGLFFAKLLGGKKNVTLKDHSDEEEVSRWFNFVSAANLHDYLARTTTELGPVLTQEICHTKGCDIPLTVINKFDD
ncbi:MAG: DUF2145 domain-containing protein [Bacteriovoracales bacterium]|nr:DUF2145 domain-containing protein [Bacteriovoracales bacterium]